MLYTCHPQVILKTCFDNITFEIWPHHDVGNIPITKSLNFILIKVSYYVDLNMFQMNHHRN
jgi:hypothetical protein